jgi:hypothetical protein
MILATFNVSVKVSSPEIVLNINAALVMLGGFYQRF